MSQKLFFFIFFSFLGISLQFDCEDFSGPTCGGHNGKYNLNCKQFSEGSSCVQIEYDDGCTINDNRECLKLEGNTANYHCYWSDTDRTKCKRINYDNGCKVTVATGSNPTCQKGSENINNDEDCFFTKDLKTCAKKKKACNLYSESNCGGLKGINNNIQCVQYPYTYSQCVEFTIDQYCQIDENSKKCIERTGNPIEDKVKNHCVLDEDKMECKLKEKDCEEYDLDKCTEFGKNCIKVNLYPSPKCRIVSIDQKCEIDSNGDCGQKSDAELESYQECHYNTDYSKCEVTNKYCTNIDDTTQCSNGKISKTGFTCSKVDNSCKEVQIDSQCKIEDGKCVISSSSDTSKNACLFNYGKTKCQYYAVDSKCKVTQDTITYVVTCGNDGLTDTKQKCAFDKETNTICNPINKECTEFKVDTECEAVVRGTKKCSWSGGYCYEYTIDNDCTVQSGNCEKKDAEANLETSYACLFDNKVLGSKSCTKKQTICENYFDFGSCSSHENGNTTHQCIDFRPSSGYCTPIEFDSFCKVDTNQKCNPKEENSINTETEICSYNDGTEKKSCKKRSIRCSDYNSDSTKCKAKDNCYYESYDNNCYESESDGICAVKGGECKVITGQDLGDYGKCSINEIEDNKYRCEKINKPCYEYGTDSEKCNSSPRTDEHQCYKFSSNCQDVNLDGNCYVNSEGKCVENGSGKLLSNEICAFRDNSKTYCGKKEKLCEDYKDSSCGNYSPEMKLCYLIDSSCREVKIDSQCSMNENNECTGNSCHLDNENDNYRCYYQNNDNNHSSLMKMSQIILLILFFMF